VCGVRDHDGSVSFEAVPCTKVKSRLKELLNDYQEAYKAWREASTEARKAGEKFEDPKPKKPGLKKLTSKIRGKDKAASVAQLYQDKYDAKRKKKEEKGYEDFQDDKPGEEGKGKKEAKGDDGGEKKT
jgi:hypothetical protein